MDDGGLLWVIAGDGGLWWMLVGGGGAMAGDGGRWRQPSLTVRTFPQYNYLYIMLHLHDRITLYSGH